MIDWDLTARELGGTDMSTYRPRVMVRCDGCGTIRAITVRVKSRIRDGQMDWWCPSCASRGSGTRQRLSTAASRRWADTEYRRHRKDASTRLWSDPEYRRRHAIAVSDQSSRRKCSEAAARAWRSEEYRRAHAVARSQQSGRVSGTEVRFHDVLGSMGVEYRTEVAVGPYSFDVAVDRGEKTVLIEVHGNYWHTRPYVIRRDEAKASYVAGLPGYELRVVWEHQLYDPARVRSAVERWLGLGSTVRKVRLRDVRFGVVDLGAMRAFMSSNHYLGSMGRAGVQLGGFVGDELVCGAVFAHPTRNESCLGTGFGHGEVLELTRFCISSGVSCRNLPSRALSRFVRMLPEKCRAVISYASPGDGHLGTIYLASNWSFMGETAGTYFYVGEDGWKLHKKTLYNRARSSHMTEAQFARRFGYRKVRLPPLKKYIFVRD